MRILATMIGITAAASLAGCATQAERATAAQRDGYVTNCIGTRGLFQCNSF